MRSGELMVTVLVIALCSMNAAPVPPDRCIPARIERRLSIPSTQQALTMPTDVAVSSEGTVFVADGVHHRIARFDRLGNILPAFESGMMDPVGIFADGDDRLWIADRDAHCVLRLKDDGAIDENIGLPPDHNQPATPTDVAITRDGSRIFVVDNTNHRLLVWEKAAGQWNILGSSGKSLGQFQYPFMIAMDSQDYVYVTEAIGARVQSISPADRWAGQISGFGVELGQVYRPKGVAVDAKNRLFISDSTLGVIQVFSTQGALQGVLSDEHRQPLRFDHPMGMCFDARGLLYVVELKANRVAVVSFAETGDSSR